MTFDPHVKIFKCSTSDQPVWPAATEQKSSGLLGQGSSEVMTGTLFGMCNLGVSRDLSCGQNPNRSDEKVGNSVCVLRSDCAHSPYEIHRIIHPFSTAQSNQIHKKTTTQTVHAQFEWKANAVVTSNAGINVTFSTRLRMIVLVPGYVICTRAVVHSSRLSLSPILKQDQKQLDWDEKKNGSVWWSGWRQFEWKANANATLKATLRMNLPALAGMCLHVRCGMQFEVGS